LFFYVFFIGPAFIKLFLDDFLKLLLSQTAVAMLQILMFTIFIYFIIIPITNTLREEHTAHIEIFLAAPIKPSDVLLGEFLGLMPIYTILVTIVAGSFTAILNPLGMDLVQIAIIVTIFIIIFFSALWIGTVLATLLRSKIGKTSKGRDIGRALAMLIALPLVAMIYGIQFGGLLEILVDPNTSGAVKTILSLLPSSWGAEIIASFVSHPSNIGAIVFETAIRLGGLIVFFFAVLFMGAKVSNRAYSLEPTTFIASIAKPDGFFYHTIKQLGGGRSFGTLLVSIFKDYSRRLENISMLTYMIGVLVLMSIFIVPQYGSSEVPIALMLIQFIFPIVVVMVTGEVTIRGKETLFIFKKAPFGIERYIKSMFLKSCLIVVPITGIVTIALSLLGPKTDLASLFIGTGLMMLFVAAYVAFVIGLFLLIPVFSDKSPKLGLNIMITVFGSIGLFAISLFILTPDFLNSTPRGLLYHQALQTFLSWVLGIIVLNLGKIKLKRIE
jgi:hypothetical protein